MTPYKCVDYWTRNKITVQNSYPVTLVVDIFDRLTQVKFFLKIDICSGCWQVSNWERHEAKTIVVMRHGAYKFLVMSFGLTNALTTFCTHINEVLHNFLDDFVVIYLDEIVIYNEALEEHKTHLENVLSHFREYKLYAKPLKCSFAQT